MKIDCDCPCCPHQPEQRGDGDGVPGANFAKCLPDRINAMGEQSIPDTDRVHDVQSRIDGLQSPKTALELIMQSIGNALWQRGDSILDPGLHLPVHCPDLVVAELR